MMKLEPTRRKAAVGDEVECDQRGGREDIKWLGGSGFWEHLPLAHTLVMFPMMAIMELVRLNGANWHVLISDFSTERSPRQLD